MTFDIPTVPDDPKEIKKADLLRHIVEIKEWINALELDAPPPSVINNQIYVDNLSKQQQAAFTDQGSYVNPSSTPPWSANQPETPRRWEESRIGEKYLKSRQGMDWEVVKLTEQQKQEIREDDRTRPEGERLAEKYLDIKQ